MLLKDSAVLMVKTLAILRASKKPQPWVYSSRSSPFYFKMMAKPQFLSRQLESGGYLATWVSRPQNNLEAVALFWGCTYKPQSWDGRFYPFCLPATSFCQLLLTRLPMFCSFSIYKNNHWASGEVKRLLALKVQSENTKWTDTFDPYVRWWKL